MASQDSAAWKLTPEVVRDLLSSDGRGVPPDYDRTGVDDAIRHLEKPVREALICGLYDRAEQALIRAENADVLAKYTTPEQFKHSNLLTATHAALLWREAANAL